MQIKLVILTLWNMEANIMYIPCKRFLDILFGIILLMVLLPIMLIIALLIKIDSGSPVIFKQLRVGINGKHFTIYKFRTMVVNAEKIGTCLDSYENDYRVTRIGKCLRNTSLDELPQILNVITGDMSFIGPRPPVIYHPFKYEDYPSEVKRRFEVRPGITGYAQVNGRNELSWDEKFRYDLYYINNLSLFLDCKILFLTVIKVLKMEGSYDIVDKKNEKDYKGGYYE